MTTEIDEYQFKQTFKKEVYGMKNWVDSLQEKPISMTNLYQRYTIIGL